MRIINLATVAATTAAGGTALLTAAQGATMGMQCVVVNPSVDIVLVDQQAVGTVANSPFVCPAGTATTIAHRAGVLNAISTSGTANVKVAIGCDP